MCGLRTKLFCTHGYTICVDVEVMRWAFAFCCVVVLGLSNCRTFFNWCFCVPPVATVFILLLRSPHVSCNHYGRFWFPLASITPPVVLLSSTPTVFVLSLIRFILVCVAFGWSQLSVKGGCLCVGVTHMSSVFISAVPMKTSLNQEKYRNVQSAVCSRVIGCCHFFFLPYLRVSL